MPNRTHVTPVAFHDSRIGSRISAESTAVTAEPLDVRPTIVMPRPGDLRSKPAASNCRRDRGMRP